MGSAERERPDVPNIPGLVKGGKIEAQREMWASRRRGTFSENKADLFVISKEAESFLKLPVLGIPGSEPKPNEITSYRLWMPRVDRATGAVSITRWESQEGVNPQAVVAFGGKKYSEWLDLAQIPKRWTIVRLIPQTYTTIESAIRASERIASYEGPEGPAQRRVEELFMALNAISEVFLHEDGVSPLRLQGLSKQAESLLEEHGLLSAKDKVWKKIAENTQRAASRDSRGRINPMISRILARSAYLSAVHRELRQRAAKEKALKLFFYLTDIQGESRSRIENVQMALVCLGGFAHFRPAAVLRGDDRFIDPRQALPVEMAIKSLVKTSLVPIEAAPYAPTARLAEAILVGRIGKSNKQYESLKQTLSESGRRELARKSAVEYLMERDATSARKRMHQAFNVLSEGIETFQKPSRLP